MCAVIQAATICVGSYNYQFRIRSGRFLQFLQKESYFRKDPSMTAHRAYPMQFNIETEFPRDTLYQSPHNCLMSEIFAKQGNINH